MSELDVGDPDGMGRVDTILVCVAPPDGGAIAATLRDRGFSVVEAPMSMLGARAVGEVPQVMIVDVDMSGAIEIVERAREASPRTELLCVGDPDRAAEIGLTEADGRAFTRPVDVEALLLAVVALAEPAVDLRQLGSAPSLQPDHARMSASLAPETTPPMRRGDSEAPPASGFPSTSDPLEVAAILPAFDDPESFGGIAPLDVSPELAQLLESAEERVSALGLGSPSSVPSPDEEVDLILPAEMLSVLDEPLSPDDDSSSTGGAETGGITGVPRPRTTGARASAAPPATTAGTALERYASTGTDVAAGRGSSISAPPPPVAIAAPASAPPPRPASAPPAARVAPEPIVDRVVLSPAIAPAAGPVTPPVVSLPQPAPPAPAAEPSLPAVLTPGDAIRAVASSIAGRASGALALGPEGATRRIVLHDGPRRTRRSSRSSRRAAIWSATSPRASQGGCPRSGGTRARR